MVGIPASQQKQAMVQVSFVRKPNIWIFPPKKYIFAFYYSNRKWDDESTGGKEFFAFFFQQHQRKNNPEKNWRDFWTAWNIGSVTYQKIRFLKIINLYREAWFLVALAAASIVIIIMVVAILCVKSKSYKYKGKKPQLFIYFFLFWPIRRKCAKVFIYQRFWC